MMREAYSVPGISTLFRISAPLHKESPQIRQIGCLRKDQLQAQDADIRLTHHFDSL